MRGGPIPVPPKRALVRGGFDCRLGFLMLAPKPAARLRFGRIYLLALAAWGAAVALGACSDAGPPNDKPPDLPDTPAPQCAPVPAAPLRLLTRHEYNMSVRDLLGDLSAPGRDFPREPLSGGLDNDATILQVGPDNVSRYFEAAEALAQKAVRTPLVPSCEGQPAAECGRTFLHNFAARVFRRPLSTQEWEVVAGLFDSVLAQQGLAAAMERSIQSLLQSPQFLYRDELGTPMQNKSEAALSGFQLASKLSYFVRGTTPDADLFAQAASGALDATAGVKAAVKQMLAQANGMDGLARFLAVYLYLDGVELAEKDAGVYPGYSRGLAHAWRRSLELFIADVLRNDASLKSLLTSRALFVNDTMSAYDHMGGQGLASDFSRLEASPDRAGGILAQPGFLAYKALHNGSSPIRRGMFVLDKLLCQPPPSPPADLVIVPPAPSTTLTTRARFDQHRADPACASCHAAIDPVGFVFENYDGMGLWRTQENGHPIDASGGIVDADDAALVGSVANVQELSTKLAQSQQVHDCVAKEIYRYAAGRPLTKQDLCWFEPISARFFDSGGNFKELISNIATSPGFRTHEAVKEAP